jgi:hypothetical protein
MNTKLPNQDVADLLAPHSPEVRNVALPARSFVFPAMPDIPEQVDAKVRIIGYGPKSADIVSMLMSTRTRVNLGIAFAIEQHDPAKLLEGTGKLRLHVKLKSKADLQSAALKSLLSAAIARREELAQKLKK